MMEEDKIASLLKQADHTAGGPASVSIDVAAVCRRAHRRQFARKAAPIAAAAVLLLGAAIWGISAWTGPTPSRQKVASLETQVALLQARTDAALNLIHEVLEQERNQHELEALEAKLASIPDPLEEMQKQADRTAFTLVYQADRLYRELDKTDSAVAAYKRVIRLFPANQWAEVARQRLSEIENKKYNKTILQGDPKWKEQNV